MVRDRLGNEIREGQLIYSISTGLKARVKSVDGIHVKLEIDFTLIATPDNPENRFGDFICAVDSDSSQASNGLLDRAVPHKGIQ